MAVFKRDKLIDISKRSEGGALVKRLESEIKELDRCRRMNWLTLSSVS